MDLRLNIHNPVKLPKVNNNEKIFAKIPISKPNFICKKKIKKHSLNIACILDNFSYECFKYECNLIPLGIKNWRDTLVKNKPDLLFVESAWEGNQGQWQSKIAHIKPGVLDSDLKKLTDWCKHRHIPTVFWGKEDPYDFDVFIEAAKCFGYVFTTDENCVPKYKSLLGHNRVFVLPFAAQPKLHNPIDKDKLKLGRVAFAGGWYNKMGDAKLGNRNDYLLKLLKPSLKYGLHIYDLFYDSKTEKSQFPKEFLPNIKPGLPYNKILKVYKMYDVFINVNSVEQSPTNFSRRVFELLACGTPTISSYSLGIEKLFPNIVKLCKTEGDTESYLKTLLENQTLRDKLSLLGQREVFKYHTYKHRLERIMDTLKLNYERPEQPGVSIITCTNRPKNMQKVLDNYAIQNYPQKELIIILNKDEMRIEEWVEKFKTYDNVRIFQLEEKVSLGVCLNYAIEQSKFEIISKFDDDDYYGPNYLTDYVNAFKYTNADIIGKYSVYAYLEDKKLLVLKFPNSENRYTSHVSGSTLTFKKHVFNKVKFHNRSVSEDTYFLKEAIKKGYKIYAADRFNHVICRRSSLNDHSWKVSESEFLEKCTIITTTADYKEFVTI